MDLGTGLIFFVYGFLLFVFASFHFQRLCWRRRKRLGKKHLGYYPRSASLGNAFQSLQIITQPRVEYILEQKLKEDADDEESGDPDSPDALLSRQLKRIRRGEEVDRLTVLFRRRRR